MLINNLKEKKHKPKIPKVNKNHLTNLKRIKQPNEYEELTSLISINKALILSEYSKKKVNSDRIENNKTFEYFRNLIIKRKFYF